MKSKGKLRISVLFILIAMIVMFSYDESTDADYYLAISQSSKIEVFHDKVKIYTIENPEFMTKFDSAFSLSVGKLHIDERASKEILKLIFYVDQKKYNVSIIQVETTGLTTEMIIPAEATSNPFEKKMDWSENINGKKVLVKMRNSYIKGLPIELFEKLEEVEQCS